MEYFQNKMRSCPMSYSMLLVIHEEFLSFPMNALSSVSYRLAKMWSYYHKLIVMKPTSTEPSQAPFPFWSLKYFPFRCIFRHMWKDKPGLWETILFAGLQKTKKNLLCYVDLYLYFDWSFGNAFDFSLKCIWILLIIMCYSVVHVLGLVLIP